MPDWKPVVITTKPGEEPVPPAPEGVIDVTPETLGDQKHVDSVHDFCARLEEKRAAERERADRRRFQNRPDDGPEAA